MKHIHAELMMAYAKDAMETDEPWLRWEFYHRIEKCWKQFKFDHPAWHLEDQYRRKAKTIKINGIKVPEPMREAPEVGQGYHVVNLLNIERTDSFVWEGFDCEQGWLDSGLCHSTKDAAYDHASALLSFTAL